MKFKIALTPQVMKGIGKFNLHLATGRRLAFDRIGRKAEGDDPGLPKRLMHEAELDKETARDVARQGYKLTPNPLDPKLDWEPKEAKKDKPAAQ